jgi:hypothetical protein
MWDLLFGKPKKRYYKPKKKIEKSKKEAKNNKENTVKKTSVSEDNTKAYDNKSNEVFVANHKNEVTINVVDENKQDKTKIEIINQTNNNQVVDNQDVEEFDQMVHNLKQEMNGVFLSAFLASINQQKVLKSWFMQEEQSEILSKIFLTTNRLFAEQANSGIKSFYILHLDEHKILFTLKLNSYQFAMLLDGKEASIGYLMNIIKPIIEKNITNN